MRTRVSAVLQECVCTPFNIQQHVAEHLLNGVFMSKFNSPLNNIRIASPCSADWDQMYGDDRKRFCGDCKLNVFNLSGMTKDEAEALIMNAQGRLCVRFYQRADGSVITSDCPVGWAKVKQRTRMFAVSAFSLLTALLSGVFFVSLFSSQKNVVGMIKMPVATPTPVRLMGDIALPPGDVPNIQGRIALPKDRPAKTMKKIGTKGSTDIYRAQPPAEG
jgi:hypothetical protein